jgi:hypothetical protein
VGFCVFEVTVNDQIATDEINSSAFEVDMNNFGLKIGDPRGGEGEAQGRLHPRGVEPRSAEAEEHLRYRETGHQLADGTYTWTTTNETGELPYIVEQKRWNKWVKVGEVMGVGKPGEHTYEFKVTPHSGENTFRVKQVDLTKRARYSETSLTPMPAAWPQSRGAHPKPKDEIIFSGNTLYEIYDQYGNIVKRGYAEQRRKWPP